MPTVGQVLVRALPAAIALVAGFPLLAWWWSFNDDSPIWALLAVLGGGYLLGWGILQITQAPHPRLGKKAERESLQRTIASTAENGIPPADPSQRSAAGARACEIVEWSLLGTAAVAGFILTAFITGDPTWSVPAGVAAINALLDVRKIRRSWRYLKAMHTALRAI